MKVFNKSKTIKKEKFALLLIAPSLIGILLLVVYPIIYSFWISLFKYDPIANSTFLGLGNYISALKNSTVLYSLKLTFVFALSATGLVTFIGLIISLIMNRDFLGKKLCRALLLIPWALPEIVCVIIWGWIYNSDYGILNYFLEKLNLISSYKSWLGDLVLTMPSVIIVQVWKSIPMVTLIFMAGLDTMPKRLYEAAQIDGANTWQSFWYITLPFLKPYLAITLVIQTMWSFRSFTLFYGLTGGGPINKTMVLSMLTYKQFFEYLKFGYGSALAYFMLILVVPFVLFYMKLFSFGSDDSEQ